jgi:hypothetical protein
MGCTFTENEASMGAAIYNYESSPIVFDSVFSNNTGYGNGATVHSEYNSNPTFNNCVFINNSMMDSGGEGCAIFNFQYGCITLINCSIIDNHAPPTGGTGGIVAYSSDLTIINSILWGNDNLDIEVDDSTTTVSYSLVDGGYSGVGNISVGPLFVDFEGGDLHLQPGSPCIDAADGDAASEFDLEGYSRVDDPDMPNTGVGPPWVDMGAYEYQP